MTQLTLCADDTCNDTRSQGIKYIGSKLKLIPHILQLAGRLDVSTILDGFSGTTRVSQAFARNGYDVVCNDIAAWSNVFATTYLKSSGDPNDYQALIDHLNSLKPVRGWFTAHYGGHPNMGCSVQADGLKRPWQIHNTQKLDAVRDEIARLALDPVDEAIAITSLILALDKVDSTIGHFASYLRNWAPRSYDRLRLEVPQLVESSGTHVVSQADIFEILDKTRVDLAYFDPPYGSNNEKMPPSRVRYASYYHIWTTVCLADRPALVGKALRRVDVADKVAASVFEDFRKDTDGRFKALQAIEKLIRGVRARWVVFSYSSGGRATAHELNRVIRENADLVDVIEVDMKQNVMASMCWTHEWLSEAQRPNREFLFLLDKG